ncbi:MAG TPA: Asp-tRNA(Asn)/Glu-tRNA(Gln) amidotransferase GatCAB subunit B, partial [Agitococcus sp.]|nr:Asp-tRNA(Asn)/Glu-tRNA(Gln) amidotransferase GatCAB subunit B [Agitococcus sp.]
LLGALNRAEKDITESPISAEQLGGLINRINDNTISGKIAKQVFGFMFDSQGKSADEIIAEKGLKQETDTGAIEAVINEVVAANPQQLADYRSGKDKLFGFFVGEVMKRSKGKANPAQVNDLLKKILAG